MLVIAIQTGSPPGGRVRWAGRRHDDDRPEASSGSSPAELFDAVFRALHDGEQVALGLDCPLTVPAAPDQPPAPGLAELGDLLGALGTWRPWTTVSTSLARWKANTSILVWQAVPAPGTGPVTASAATESFFRQFPARGTGAGTGGSVVNLAAAAARRTGLASLVRVTARLGQEEGADQVARRIVPGQELLLGPGRRHAAVPQRLEGLVHPLQRGLQLVPVVGKVGADHGSVRCRSAAGHQVTHVASRCVVQRRVRPDPVQRPTRAIRAIPATT
jgi:hypothetical protein